MNCKRAAEVLRGLEKNELHVESEEIDEVLALGLAVEAEPEDLATLHWLESVVRTHARTSVADPSAKDVLAASLRETEERLKSDWYRIKASKAEVRQKEADRIAMRRAVATLNDAVTMASLMKIVNDSRQLAPGAQDVACEQLGSERYALTHKGWRVRGQLKPRLARFAEVPFKSFLHTFDKTEAKMFAFGNEIAALSAGIGYVRKNRAQIVIGLAKVGGPSAQALGTYNAALRSTNAPDIAVICARNAGTLGGTESAARRLQEAQAALRRVGFPSTPIVMGAAKSLLGFALEPGVLRFVEIHRRLEQAFGRGQEILFKFTARLMPATGTPADVVGRAIAAASSLVYFGRGTPPTPPENLRRSAPLRVVGQVPSSERAHPRDVRAAAVALASMVKSQDRIPEIVTRYRHIEAELVRA
ncbi:MAG: hypothetical protein K0S65_4420, partial [Labilithrix sp.]|nr:hypothetical protein [Labilithrix sp.]